MDEATTITDHCEGSSLVGVLRNALAAIELGERHSRGLAATVELAQALSLNETTHMIDIR
jgi:hypothetical protein